MDQLKSIKNHLKIQSEYLIVIESYIPFLNKLKNLNEKDILKRPYLSVVTRMVKCDLVISISVLCDYNSDYSFSKLRNKEVSLGNQGMSKTDREQSCKMVNEITEIYEGLNLKYIRDKYCAHLDKRRNNKKLELNKLDELYTKMCCVNKFYGDNLFQESSAFGINKGILTELLDDNKLLLKYINEERRNKSNR
ncbi:hypothetical protein OAD07_00920 [Flavobacteriaceae bacterium]|nr:hypothetical protein [Flavobacteriaceae bacterium]